MKLYFHMSIEGFSNCYVVVNEEINEALIVDPGKITFDIIDEIEKGGYKLSSVLVTHKHTSHVRGLETLKKLYSPKVYAADFEFATDESSFLKGDGSLVAAGLPVTYYSIPGHTPDSICFRIGQMLFTGDCLSACMIGNTNSKYSERVLLLGLKNKILSDQTEVLVLPGHGPPSTLEAEKNFNISFGSLI